ncbi:methionine adenosyltransferase [Neorickettsia helminthoeca str. Oregon]|uniref:Methionine adenosyltransferase n=1 Tax=Neorickettsia helminthoeca str. Oregon TaxID=1286528 RepID=X5HK02_9RICK|nr:methionine adenosyltransferase [Neorickettsia helminthoeca]AHX11404.1 methionine adenosyltransferase [Neorickettsia helminthoeca str. Oregon]
MRFGFRYFTSEAVLPGHPDKIADQISDLILDMYLKKDPCSRTAIEVMVSHKKIIIAGEVYGPRISNAEIEEEVRLFLKHLGYPSYLLDWGSVEIVNLLHEQSSEIATGVRSSAKHGAGDQGIMFGYATDETPVGMPAPLYYARRILQAVVQERLFGPDGKSQVTIEYDHYGNPIGVSNVVVSVQHPESVTLKDLRERILEKIVAVLPSAWNLDPDNIFINPAGSFTKGGPISDCGLTGRKIVVDTYGGMLPNGGGAFSGKDSTKVDRSAAYLARYIAKNIVFSGLAHQCGVQLCYAIGIDRPLTLQVATYGTARCKEGDLLSRIEVNIDSSPRGISELLHLTKPIYLKTASRGHFGNQYDPEDLSFKWEDLDLAPLLSSEIKVLSKVAY